MEEIESSVSLEKMRGRWIPDYDRNSERPCRMFCFPFAGGNRTTYAAWINYASSIVDVLPIQLPGRLERLSERPFTIIDSLIDDLKLVTAPLLDRPFALFGHSMGALIAFELARVLLENGHPLIRLFVSGCRSPSLLPLGRNRHLLSDAEFIRELSRIGGTQENLLGNTEIMSLTLACIRADFSMVDNYVCNHEEPLSCPISAFGGLQDEEVNKVHVREWQEETSKGFSLRMVPGGHFFINSHGRFVRDAVEYDLRSDLQ